MAYAPDMGAAAPAPTWMGGHSSIEQPMNPFIAQLVQWLMQQHQLGQGGAQSPRPQPAGLGLDTTFNLQRPGPLHAGLPRHPEQDMPGRSRIEHVANIAAIAKQLAGRNQINRAFQPHLNRVSINRRA